MSLRDQKMLFAFFSDTLVSHSATLCNSSACTGHRLPSCHVRLTSVYVSFVAKCPVLWLTAKVFESVCCRSKHIDSRSSPKHMPSQVCAVHGAYHAFTTQPRLVGMQSVPSPWDNMRADVMFRRRMLMCCHACESDNHSLYRMPALSWPRPRANMRMALSACKACRALPPSVVSCCMWMRPQVCTSTLLHGLLAATMAALNVSLIHAMLLNSFFGTVRIQSSLRAVSAGLLPQEAPIIMAYTHRLSSLFCPSTLHLFLLEPHQVCNTLHDCSCWAPTALEFDSGSVCAHPSSSMQHITGLLMLCRCAHLLLTAPGQPWHGL